MPEHRAYLSLGSNIAPERNLPEAVDLLAQHGRLLAVSAAWQSAALGRPEQPDFVNAAALLVTTLTAAELKAGPLAAIEAALGRVRSVDKYAPRPIDIDIMLFDDAIFNLGEGRIPSPEIYERAFVAVPLAEIAPDYVHPETGESLAAIAARFGTAGLRLRPDIPSWPRKEA